MKKKIKTIVIFGTRPEAIKVAPLIERIKRNKNFVLKTAVTGQHRKMLDQVLEIFKLKPEYDLNIMTHEQTLNGIAWNAIKKLEKVFGKEKPDLVLVQGDTTTTAAASLAAFYSGTAVGHIEAGLRTYDRYSPYPEEINRRITDLVTEYYFAPTAGNKNNLLNEGVDEKKIYVTGNTVIDALFEVAGKKLQPENKKLGEITSERLILVTAHRRESHGKPLENIFKAVKRLSKTFPGAAFVFPVHLNPNVKIAADKYLSDSANVFLIPPVSYSDMVWLLKNCYICLTDSGGLQEEAPSLGVPVGVLREKTERPEAVHAGTVKMLGTDTELIFNWTQSLLQNKKQYEKFSKAVNPYGDGRASERIISAIEYNYKLKKEKPSQWKM